MEISNLKILHGHELLNSVTDVTEFFSFLYIIDIRRKRKYLLHRRDISE